MELLNIINSKESAEVYNLKELDQISAIEHSCQRLNLDLKEDLFKNDDYLIYFFAVDDKTRLHVEKIAASYLKIDIINQQYKSRMARAAFLHHRLMFSIYFKLIVSLAPSKHPQLGKLIGRAINNATEIIKWRYLNYQGAPGNVWLQISSLYDMAEKYQLTTEEIDFYPDLASSEFIPKTIDASYIAINMLGNLDSLSFKPQQVDFISKMLGSWTNGITVDKTYNDKRHLFSVDMEKNMSAKRIRNVKDKITNRYWCMDTINVKIQIIMNCIETKRSPKLASMQAMYNHLYAHQTLTLVKSEWSLSEYKRQRRANPRIKTDKVGTNAFGFEDTYYQIKHYEDSLVEVKQKSFSQPDEEDDRADDAANALKQYAESMTAFVNVNHGFCNIVDESLNGLCIHVEKKPHELSIGMMLGIAIKDNRHGVKIGIIRSIKTTDNHTLRVGVEIISRNAFSITGYKVKQTGVKTANEPVKNQGLDDDVVIRQNPKRLSIAELIEAHPMGDGNDEFHCLFLPKEFSFNQAQTLILPKNQYQESAQYEMMIAKDPKRIQITQSLEQHENWIRVQFAEVAMPE